MGKFSFSTQRYVIELDGAVAGWLSSVDAGLPRAETVTGVGVGNIQKKHIAHVSLPDSSFTCGAGMSSAFYDWLISSLENNPVRKDVAFVAVNEKNELGTGWEFYQTVITEVVFPTLDGSSKDPAKFTVKFAPDRAVMRKASSGKLGVYGSAKGKIWSSSEFRLSIPGLETACKAVTRIEPLSTKFKVSEVLLGERRIPDRVRGKAEYPDLVVTVLATHAQEFFDWHQKFVLEGNNTDDQEKTGYLEYLDPTAGFVYFRVDFKNLGIVELQSSGHFAKASMYCEDIDFSYQAKASLP